MQGRLVPSRGESRPSITSPVAHKPTTSSAGYPTEKTEEALESLRNSRPRRSSRFTCERQEWSRPRLAIARVVESHAHELLLAVVIVANLIAFIMETDARVADEGLEKWEFLSRYVFLPIYTLDLWTRLYVYRRKFCDNKWNVMEASLVISDSAVEVAEWIFKDAATDEVQVFSLLRGLRLCRLARFARVMVVFKELHMMLHAFLSAMKTMFWASCMLAVLLTFCSILAVEFVHPVNVKLAERGVYGDCSRCERAFSTVMHANLTFVQQILAGDNWGRLSVPLIEEEPGLAIILLSALVVINLGLLNLILTVIVNAASEARKNDKRLQADENSQKFEAMEKHLVRICAELDVNEDGLLSLEELVDALDTNANFRDICEALDIHKDDMQVIYAFLDANGDGMVTYAEFVEQAFKIRQLDVNSFLVTLRGVLNRMSMEMRAEIRNLKGDVAVVSKDVKDVRATCSSSQCSEISPQANRFESLDDDKSDVIEAHAVHADRHAADCTFGFCQRPVHACAVEPKEKDDREFYWAELDAELASLRQRLDASITDFVSTTLSKLNTHAALQALMDERESDGDGRCPRTGRVPDLDSQRLRVDGAQHPLPKKALGAGSPLSTALGGTQSSSSRRRTESL